jgi:phosphopantothenoylcysteine decarboxylase/phosphopantothenate--cysteine ligase
MKKILKGKKILITAGPVWVPIDKVRVITNVFSGRLGWIIVKLAHKMGAEITLLMGPGKIDLISKKIPNLKIIYFRYFDELLKLAKKEVASKKYDIMIHSAAVNDYAPIISREKKIKSGKQKLIIKLKPTIKIVDLVKKLDPSIFLIKFKLEVDISKKKLIDISYKSMLKSKADLMVANNMKTVAEYKSHKAFIIDPQKNIKKVIGKEKIASSLLKMISSKLKN